jgi:hypothetical protein
MPILFDAASWTLSLDLWSLQNQKAKSQELFVVLDAQFPLLPPYNTIMAVLLSRVLLYQDSPQGGCAGLCLWILI